MKKWVCALIVLIAGNCHAHDGITSELGHAATGAVLAGMVVGVFSESEHRAWIGFTVSTAAIVISEGSSVARGAATTHSSLLDVAWHTAGAALGAWITDRYILIPTVNKSFVGVTVLHPF